MKNTIHNNMDMNILSELLCNLDVTYIIMCNVVTYIIIKTIMQSFPSFNYTTGLKKITSALSALGLAAVMYSMFEHSPESLFYGFFLQFITWDYAFKGWLQKISKVFGQNDSKDVFASANPAVAEMDGPELDA